MFFRVVVLVGAVDARLLARVGLAMLAFGLPSLAICWLLWRRQRPAETASVSAGQNPFELGEAIRFGLLFGVITFAAKAAQVYLGDTGAVSRGCDRGTHRRGRDRALHGAARARRHRERHARCRARS